MLNSPIVLPIIFFVIVILLGSILLHGSEKNKIDSLSWTDAAFTATSAACVTGLVVVDTGSYFTQFGQVTILFLMQIGGLGIMTFTSLFGVLAGKQLSVRQSLVLQDAYSEQTVGEMRSTMRFIMRTASTG